MNDKDGLGPSQHAYVVSQMYFQKRWTPRPRRTSKKISSIPLIHETSARDKRTSPNKVSATCFLAEALGAGCQRRSVEQSKEPGVVESLRFRAIPNRAICSGHVMASASYHTGPPKPPLLKFWKNVCVLALRLPVTPSLF